MKIVLVGFMCSGKSRVGKILSKKLGWPHYDTDEFIVSHENRSIAEIIAADGEPAFRDLERAAVLALSAHDNSVLSTGGGVPLDPSNRDVLLPGSFWVWLKVSPETVLQRAGQLKTRPLIDPGRPLESIRRRMEEREPAYAHAAMAVETDRISAEAIAEKIMQRITVLP
jgi:shikimate kinase